MDKELLKKWKELFYSVIDDVTVSDELKKAVFQNNLGEWTKILTDVVVETSKKMGWVSCARNNKAEILPISRNEYLTIDVVSFPKSNCEWKFPVAAIELENSNKNDIIAYSLWKVICIRVRFRLVYCYRQNKKEVSSLIGYLNKNVLSCIPVAERQQIKGLLGIVIGCRDEINTFPYRYFRWWQYCENTGKFEQFI